MSTTASARTVSGTYRGKSVAGTRKSSVPYCATLDAMLLADRRRTGFANRRRHRQWRQHLSEKGCEVVNPPPTLESESARASMHPFLHASNTYAIRSPSIHSTRFVLSQPQQQLPFESPPARDRDPALPSRRLPSPNGSYVSTQDHVWVVHDNERSRKCTQHDDPTPSETDRRNLPREKGH